MNQAVTDTATSSSVEDASHDAGAHGHPSDWDYIKIALVLAAFTGVEVFTYFESVIDWGDALIPSLLVMMVIKFWLVTSWFMHLKFDNPIFGRMFVTGLVLATGVFIITLSTFEFWAG